MTTQLLYAAAKLGLADALAAGPQTGPVLAAAVGADPAALVRALRGLVLDGVVAEEPDGRFALTPLGDCLREEAPGCCAARFSRGASVLPGRRQPPGDAARRRGVVQHAFGMSFFDYLGGDSEREAVFQASMANRAPQEAAAVVASYDFGASRRLIDVGGGTGIFLTAILRAAPHLRGVLFDRATVVAIGAQHLAAAGLAERCECVAGDLFAAVPAGADTYLLSRGLPPRLGRRGRHPHPGDLPPGDAGGEPAPAGRIGPARACGGRAGGGADGPLHADDLRWPGAHRRGDGDLLAAAGLSLRRVVPTATATGISVIEAVPADVP